MIRIEEELRINSRHRSQLGFTMIELIFALAGIASIAAAAFFMTDATSNLSQATQNESLLTRKATAPLHKISSEIYQAQFSSIAIDADASGVSFQRILGFQAGAPILENTKKIALTDDPSDLPDGVDNDQDGLIDEKCITITTDFLLPTETVTVIAQNISDFPVDEINNGLDDNGDGLVDERGLSFSLDGVLMTVNLTINFRNSDGVVLNRAGKLTFALRNQ